MNNLEKAGRKITAALLVSQSLFSASVIMIFTISSIIAVQLARNNNQWTGVPSTLILVGAALVAYPIGRLMDRAGRRIGLSVGHLFGILGVLIAGVAVINESLWVFLGGVLLVGLAKGVIDLGRYAAAEANAASKLGGIGGNGRLDHRTGFNQMDRYSGRERRRARFERAVVCRCSFLDAFISVDYPISPT